MKFPHTNRTDYFLALIGVNPNDLELESNLSSMSNTNYLFRDSKGSRVVLRVNNESNSRIIVRNNEKANSQLVESLGVGPRVCFSGTYKVSEYILEPEIFDKQNDEHTSALCSSLAILHGSGQAFCNIFNPIQLAYDYLSGLKHADPELIKELTQEVKFMEDALKKSLTTRDYPVPCQIDLVPENLLYSQFYKKMFIIDQEYSGNFYPEWDLAELSSETNMTEEEEGHLYNQYQQISKTSLNFELFLVCKALCNLLWLAWTLYYKESGEELLDYYSWKLESYKLAKHRYKEVLS